MSKTENTQRKDDLVSLRFNIGFDGKPEQNIELAIHAFDGQGTWLAGAPVKEGGAELNLRRDQAMGARLLIAPPTPDDRRKIPPTTAPRTRHRHHRRAGTRPRLPAGLAVRNAEARLRSAAHSRLSLETLAVVPVPRARDGRAAGGD